MGGELVTDASPPPRGKTYSEIFQELEAFYIAIGMTFEQYWDGDATMPRAYRKAHEIRKKELNEYAWLQGMYVYHGVGCLAPIFNMNSKAGTKANPYPEKPYAFNSPPQTEEEQEEADKKEYDEMQARMTAFMERFNKDFAENNKKGGDSNGRE